MIKTKFKVGDKVKWNDGKHHNDNKRIDVITEVISDFSGATRYMTEETNMPKGQEPKIGMAYENYLVLEEQKK